MNYAEETVLMRCADDTLVGILARPQVAARTGVVVVVGGPQVRVGSHRQFAGLSRELATQGHAVLRFDVRGMGDSTGAQRGFDQLDEDIEAAVSTLRSLVPGLRKVVLWGLCDGASAALLYTARPGAPLVDGLALANPWVRSPTLAAKTRLKHYYVQRLLSADFWRKLLTGRVAVSSTLGEVVQTARTAQASATEPAAAQGQPAAAPAYTERMTAAAKQFRGAMVLILSGDDHTADEFREFVKASRTWRTLMRRADVTRAELVTADHTFSNPGAAHAAAEVTRKWLSTI
ncbi:Hydrolase 1, exosortase A system-associated [Rubrivivax sp. A210]|uniref:hydrolase 1, exosortase A system-associated n=1 Tax=Rubrivivax sp. A210 TaxID=2772301 RepID=UPI001917E75E|nr:hydrolase 1, exosortase A system-associated [Rubrivivax sp. A210]CAD5375230.1 Hydrolase 1, exosortase A system-associated [Rubrivivax sp. A210]